MVHLPSGSDENEGNISNSRKKMETTTNEIKKGSLLQSKKSEPYLLDNSSNESIIAIISSSISNKGKDIKKKVTIDQFFSIGISCYILTNLIDQWYDNIYTYINFFRLDSSFSSLNLFSNFLPSGHIYSYFYPSWAIEYISITDIESLAILVYIAYPTA